MRETENRNHDLEVIAGPCSVDGSNIKQLYNIAEIMVSDGRGGTVRGITAERLVTLKSRTAYDETGEGMGVDFPIIEQVMMTGFSEEVPPGVLMAQEFVKKTGVGIAAEIMIPHIQLPFYEGRIPKGQMMAWTPSVNQLGWTTKEMAQFARRNEWTVGVKNGKWLGTTLKEARQTQTITSMERTWAGLISYANGLNCNVVFIHRGVDVPEKKRYRNAPVHEIVKRLATKFPQVGRYFDPSHSLGPKLRDSIVEATIEAMKIKIGNNYLYTGILVEAGTSITDTEQHISVNELETMLQEISKFRKLGGPWLPTE